MRPAQIGKAYDQIVDLWTSEEFSLQNGIAAHERALSFAKNKGLALDVGCGCTGRFIDLLIEQDFTPEGIDISGEMIRQARLRHPDVRFHHHDICEWPIERKYDFISAWDSIWHIPLTQQVPVLTKLVSSLNTGGVLIFTFGGTDEPGEHTDDFMGPEVYYSTLGTNGFLNLMMELCCVVRHVERDKHPELHTYLIAQKTAVKAAASA